MKSLNQWLTLGVVVSVLALPTFAQTTQTQPTTQAPSAAAGAAQATPCEEQAALDLYNRFRENVKTDQKVAFEAGNQYLEKYSSCEYAKYVKTFVDKYSKAAGKFQIADLLKQGKYAEAYALGKQNLASEPEDLQTLINTSYAGLRVATAPGAPDTASTEASNYATKTVKLIEAGKSPGKEPMTAKDKDDTLGWLNYALGIYAIKNNPAEAIKYLHQAATYEGWAKKDPQTFSLLASAYQSGMYLPLSTEYKKKYEGQPESPESKAAIAQLDQVMDRMIDAYARAVSLATDPKVATQKAELTQTLTEMLKIRNTGQTVDAVIQGVASKPLPSPTLPAAPTTTTAPSDPAGTPATTTTPADTTTAAPTSTAAPTGATPTTAPTTTTSPATTTTPQSGTKPAGTQTTQPSTTQPSTAQPKTTQPGSTTTTTPSGKKPNTTTNSTRP
ncbi:MAG: hypothetical protein H0T92_11590 [Pyrinomonadaceae bacterium]|nr:hypothetical protein [Pyrinomonadaceae bacterium]